MASAESLDADHCCGGAANHGVPRVHVLDLRDLRGRSCGLRRPDAGLHSRRSPELNIISVRSRLGSVPWHLKIIGAVGGGFVLIGVGALSIFCAGNGGSGNSEVAFASPTASPAPSPGPSPLATPRAPPTAPPTPLLPTPIPQVAPVILEVVAPVTPAPPPVEPEPTPEFPPQSTAEPTPPPTPLPPSDLIPPPVPAPPALGAALVAADGQYLGLVTCNRFDTDGIFNRYGSYGSRYSSTRIWNKYS